MVNIFRKLVIVCVPAMVLVGCGEKGFSVSSESTAGTDTESKLHLDRIKEISGKSEQKSTLSMPAIALITDAMLPIVDVLNTDIPQSKARWNAIKLTGRENFSGPLMYVESIRNQLTKSTPDDFSREKSRIEQALLDADPTHTVPLQEKLNCLSIGTDGNLEKAKSCLTEFYIRSSVAMYIGFAHRPQIAWEVHAQPYKLGETNFVPLTIAESKELNDYTLALMVFVEFANLIEGELAGKLATTTMRDPIDAKVKIQQSLFNMSMEKLRGASEQALSTALANKRQGINIPPKTTGPEFSAGSSFYLFDKSGGTLTKSGVAWFSGNEGKINGKKYELALESSVSASTTKKKSGDQSVTVKGSTSEKAGTEIK